jgi:penicillin-binding protein 1C
VRKRKKLILSFGLVAASALVGSFYLPYPRSKLDPGPVLSLRLTDRNGVLLRDVLSDEGGRCRWVRLEEISPHLVRATLVAEDRNFFLHDGIHLPSVARASVQNLRKKKIISGASTITQQVVRNIERNRRTWITKIVEAWLAVRLEKTISKEEILVQYLNRISYGNRAFGVEAASRLYFNKPASQLSPAEAAYLAGIPRSPSVSNPYRDSRAAVRRQREILGAMAREGFLAEDDLRRSMDEELRVLPDSERFRAPHFCDAVLSLLPGPRRYGWNEVRTTLDFSIQEKVEILLRQHIAALEGKGISNGAAVVLDNATGEVLAMAGSREYFDEPNDGQVNGVLALRQPGSALKPFTYALALERGMTAATVIADAPSSFLTLDGEYEPQNYDRRFHGPTRMRAALACSYNVPAVAVLESMGTDLLYRKLRELGFESLRRPAGFYGLGLTLGNGEVSLLELVQAYAALAEGGRFRRARMILSAFSRDGKETRPAGLEKAATVFRPETSFIITHILSDPDARIPAFGYRSPLSLPFACAAKTGTSKDYRDNWTVGYTTRHTVGVWVGNFDGKPMHDVSGITGCGPLFRDIMLLLNGGDAPGPFAEPKGIVRRTICPESGDLAGPACPGSMEEIFQSGTAPTHSCPIDHGSGRVLRAGRVPSRPGDSALEPALVILFPRDGGIFKIDPVLRREYQALKFRAALDNGAEAADVEWWVNGKMIGRSPSAAGFPWNLEPGSFTIRAVIESDGRKTESRPVRIHVVP